VTPNIHYEEREIEGERLELTDTKALYWLGPDLTLRRCTLLLGVGGRLIDCTIAGEAAVRREGLDEGGLEGVPLRPVVRLHGGVGVGGGGGL